MERGRQLGRTRQPKIAWPPAFLPDHPVLCDPALAVATWSRCLDRRGTARSLGTTGSESSDSVRPASGGIAAEGERGHVRVTGYLVGPQTGQGMPGSMSVVFYSAFSDRKSLATHCGTGATVSREPHGERRRRDHPPLPRDQSGDSNAGGSGGDLVWPPRRVAGRRCRSRGAPRRPRPVCGSCWRIAEGWLEAPGAVDGEDQVLSWLVDTVLQGGSAMIDDVPFGRVRPLRQRVTRQIKATIGGKVTTELVSPTTILVHSGLVVDAKTEDQHHRELHDAMLRLCAGEAGLLLGQPDWRPRWSQVARTPGPQPIWQARRAERHHLNGVPAGDQGDPVGPAELGVMGHTATARPLRRRPTGFVRISWYGASDGKMCLGRTAATTERGVAADITQTKRRSNRPNGVHTRAGS
jgi:hypothetical protein